jgi:hypothetical protein
MKKKLENFAFSRAVGKSTLLRIDWKDWNKELPKSGAQIWVVIRLENGFYPVQGTYWDETLPASADGKFPSSRWQSVKFTDYGVPEIYLRSKEQKRLRAWGYNVAAITLGKECKKCKRLECACNLK